MVPTSPCAEAVLCAVDRPAKPELTRTSALKQNYPLPLPLEIGLTPGTPRAIHFDL